MALTIDEIREAALSGKSFTLTDIKLIDMSYDNGELSLRWEMPQMQNKHYCPDMVVDYISICEKPKHDPYRLFKKGDVVEPKQVKGRVYSKDSKYLIGKKCIVFRDEEEPGYVVISYAGKNYSINAAYLELITPVEELEPYSVVRPENYQCVRIMKEKRIHSSIPFDEEECVYRTPEEAKAAAEAECARLNEEYRKEQQ